MFEWVESCCCEHLPRFSATRAFWLHSEGKTEVWFWRYTAKCAMTHWEKPIFSKGRQLTSLWLVCFRQCLNILVCHLELSRWCSCNLVGNCSLSYEALFNAHVIRNCSFNVVQSTQMSNVNGLQFLALRYHTENKWSSCGFSSHVKVNVVRFIILHECA